MKEFTLGKSLMDVSSVASVLTKQESYRFIKEFTLGKSLMNVHIEVIVLAQNERRG